MNERELTLEDFTPGFDQVVVDPARNLVPGVILPIPEGLVGSGINLPRPIQESHLLSGEAHQSHSESTGRDKGEGGAG